MKRRAPAFWLEPLLYVALGSPGVARPASAPPTCDAEALLEVSPSRAADCRCASYPPEPAQLSARLTDSPGDLGLAFCLARALRTEPERSVELYRRAAEGFARAGDSRGEFLARRNLSIRLVRLNRETENAAELARLRAVVGLTRSPPLEAEALVLEAQHLLRFAGDLERAQDVLLRAQERLRGRPPGQIAHGVLLLLGNVAAQMGRWDEAIDWARRLVATTREQGDLYLLAGAQYNLANMSLAREEDRPSPGGRARVVSLARETLDRAVAGKNETVALLSRAMLGALLAASDGDRAEARRHLETCIERGRALKQPRETSYCLQALGRLEADASPKKAVERSEEAFARRAKDASPKETVEGSEEGFARRAKAASDRGRRLTDEAVALAGVTGDRRTLAFAWGGKMRLAWRPPRSEEQAWSESLSALQSIEALRGEQADGFGRAALFSTWTRDYHWLSGRLLSSAPVPDRDAVARAFQVMERMRARVLLERLGRRETAADASFVPLDEVEASLDADEALLAFQVGLDEDAYGEFGGGAWVLAVTRGGTRVHRIPDRTVIDPNVVQLRGLVGRRDGAEVDLATRLGEALLGPALQALPSGVRKLVLVPDGWMHALPFGVLRTRGSPTALPLDYALSVAPSATLWRHWKRRSGSLPAPALVFADPELPGATGGGDPRDSEHALGRLPYARAEGRAVTRRVGGGARLYSGAAATEQRFKITAPEGHAVIHVAAHAVVDDERPENSFVLLAAGGGEDGHLRLQEIAAVELRDPVVVLSACRSASGVVLSGEGVAGLAQAFLGAGARVVVGTLWPLRDDDARAFFDEFYQALTRGNDVTGALRAAQAARIRAGAPAAAWAGVIAVGDGGVVPFPGGVPASPSSPATFWWLVAMLPALAAAWLAWRYRRRDHGR